MESSVFRGIYKYFHRILNTCNTDTRDQSIIHTKTSITSKATLDAKQDDSFSLVTVATNEPQESTRIQPKPISENVFKIRNLDTGREVDVRDENRLSFAGHLASMLGMPSDDLENFYLLRRARNLELLSAASRGNAERCKELLDKKVNGTLAAGINSRGPNGETALHIASNEGHTEVCKTLLMNIDGVDINAKMKDGKTPLHLACEAGQYDIVKLLLLCGASVNAADKQGNLPLHIAAKTGRLEIVKKLMERFSDPLVVNNKGLSSIDLASEEIVNVLMEHINPVVNIEIQDCSEEKPDTTNEQYAVSEKVGAGAFEIISMLGKGSFGHVYLVKKVENGCYYALKVLNKRQITQNNLLKYAITEKNVLSYIRHPFIVSLRYAFQTPQKLCLVLDYCPGGDLGGMLSNLKKFSEELTRLYAAEIILAIEHLHSLNIIYRDLKPENVILDADGHALLTDFGLSKEGVADAQITQSFCGSVAYLAPEILSRKGHGKSVDWYLLGVMMYEMMVGRPPFFDSKREQMFRNIQSGPLQLPNYLSPEAKDLLKRLITRDPIKRLGAASDSSEIKSHAFFRPIDWKRVLRREYKLPCPPKHTIIQTVIESSKVYGDLEAQSRRHIEGWTFIAS